MRVTTWSEYSLLLILRLAERRAISGEATSARTLSDEEGLPADYVEKIMSRLRKSGVVMSVRGARGGYHLSRDPAEITVYDVMHSDDRPTFEVNCIHHRLHSDRCDPEVDCSLRPVWMALRDRIESFLKGVTIADMMQDEHRVRDLMSGRGDR